MDTRRLGADWVRSKRARWVRPGRHAETGDFGDYDDGAYADEEMWDGAYR
jgi:hypothetical protein